MTDIIDDEEIDRDIIDPDDLDKLFCQKYNLLTEQAVSLNKSYVNKLSVTKSLKLAVSLSDNTIEAYEINNTSISKICRLSGHDKALTDVVCSPTEDHLIYSAGEDGVVKLWDTRAHGTCVLEYRDEENDLVRPYACLDVSCAGGALCAGSLLVQDDAYLVFWDVRAPAPLGGYWNSHTDDITQVKFHKSKKEVLATGALDGLINIFNIMEQTEDDALTYSLNGENSPEKMSWVSETLVSCVTESNELQLWDAHTGDLYARFGRDKVARSIKRSQANDCYLVDCYGARRDGAPVLLAGSHGGDGHVLRSVAVTQKKLQPCSNLTENKQIVRCLWYCDQRDLLITAGESGIVSVWSGTQGCVDTSAVHARIGSQKRHYANRNKPY